MAQVFDRDYLLTLDTFDVTGLDCSFRVQKDIKPSPNKCEIEVYGLAESTRKILEQKRIIPVRLRAGYKTRLFQLYLGTLHSSGSRREGPDIVTKIASVDSAKATREGRVQISVPKVPNATHVLTDITKALGVDAGNLLEHAGGELGQKLQAMFSGGRPVSGSAARILTDICRSTGHEWSVQDGKLLLLQRGRALAGRALLVRDDAGLVGSPSVDAKGVVSARMFLVPEVVPGRLVQFDSLSIKGFFRIEQVEYIGQTWGNDWYADFHARRVS